MYDASKQVVAIWKYLIESSEKDILSLPDVSSKIHIDTFTQLSQVEKDLIGFHLCRGKAKPRKIGHGQNSWNRDKVRIAENLHKIRHWKVSCKSYEQIRNFKATYFIDPPYRGVNTPSNGDRYPHSTIDYEHLAGWATSRNGQVIVCEGAGADWLPFKRLTTVNGNTNNRVVKKQEELLFTS